MSGIQQVIHGYTASGTFAPTDVSGLQVWLKADAGLTLNTTGYSGTGTVAQTGNTLTGVGTNFTNEVAVGDVITATGINGTVSSISNTTSIVLSSSATAGGGAFTIVPQAGATDRVSGWADQSGNGNNAAQTTAKNQPLKIPSVQNGIAGIRGNGNPGVVQTNQSIFTGSISHGIGTGDFYIITAAQLIAVDANYHAIFAANASNGASTYWRNNASNHYGLYIAGFQAFTGAASTGSTVILEVYRSSGVYNLVINGSADATTITNSNSIADGNFILFDDDVSNAGDAPSSAYTFEVCFYNSLPSSGNRTSLRNYMNTRWVVF